MSYDRTMSKAYHSVDTHSNYSDPYSFPPDQNRSVVCVCGYLGVLLIFKQVLKRLSLRNRTTQRLFIAPKP